jgi:hypothetical protein
VFFLFIYCDNADAKISLAVHELVPHSHLGPGTLKVHFFHPKFVAKCKSLELALNDLWHADHTMMWLTSGAHCQLHLSYPPLYLAFFLSAS